MTRVHRLLRAGLLTLGVLGGASAFGVSPALAGTGHGPVTGEFGGQFSFPTGIAVNPSSGDVYVMDLVNRRVEWFNSAGTYEGQFNGSGTFEVKGKVETGTAAPLGQFTVGEDDVAVDPKSGNVWVSDDHHGVVDKFNSEGEYAVVQLTGTPEGAKITGEAPFSEPRRVAVDPKSGNVYVANSNGVVDKFTSAGAYVLQFTASTAYGLAVDSEGNVYVGESGGVQEFSSTGVSKSTFGSGHGLAFAVAVDPSSGDVYVDYGNVIGVFQFQAVPLKWALIYQFGSPLTASWGLAVSLNGTIYASELYADDVKIFAAGATANEPKTEAATNIEGTTATVNGELKEGESGYYFAYNDNGSCKGAGETPEGAAPGTVVKESANLTGLEPNTLYTFCIAATNAYGPEFGPPLTFTTKPAPPLVEEVSVLSVGPGEATLQAKVNPENWTAECWVEYGKTTKYEEAPVFCEPASVAGHGGQLAALQLEGLQASTVYDYRVVAKNANKQTSGPSEGVGEFTTAPEPTPLIEAESVSSERKAESGSGLEVTFIAQVNPEGRPTTSCAFEYGKLGQAYGPPVPCEQSPAQIGEGHKGKTVSAKVTGLQAGVDYHYRAVVANKTNTGKGAEQVFGPPAEVTTGAVLSNVPGVAPGTSATVGGEVNPEELDTRYYVQYGETEAYGQITPFLPPGIKLPLGIDAGSGSVSVVLGSKPATPDVPLEALSPGATYHYRLVAYNADGTSYGADEMVKVLPAPQVGPASVSEVTQESATISTSVNPEGLHTLYKLDVGTSTAYGTPHPGDAGSGSAPVPLTFDLTGLEPGTTYHFRLTASNGDGISSEADQTFTTAAKPPEVPLELIKPPSELGIVSFTAKAFPNEPVAPGPPPVLTRAQKLAKALKACKKKHPKSKRAACIKQARKQYAPAKKAKK